MAGEKLKMEFMKSMIVKKMGGMTLNPLKSQSLLQLFQTSKLLKSGPVFQPVSQPKPQVSTTIQNHKGGFEYVHGQQDAQQWSQ